MEINNFTKQFSSGIRKESRLKRVVEDMPYVKVDWENVPDGTWVFGRIHSHNNQFGMVRHFEGHVYLLQNVASGDRPSDGDTETFNCSLRVADADKNRSNQSEYAQSDEKDIIRLFTDMDSMNNILEAEGVGSYKPQLRVGDYHAEIQLDRERVNVDGNRISFGELEKLVAHLVD
jgi:hypothetical protein